jgi:hydroxyethylthiazole kinase-like uncharacterized protein yjeF
LRLATATQSKRIDTRAQRDYELSDEVLMEAAGAESAREIEQSFIPELRSRLTIEALGIVCGPGNNGGDGLVVARHLRSSGHRHVIIYLVAPAEKRTDLFKLQLKRAQLAGVEMVDIIRSPGAVEAIKKARLIVDAVFGIGIKGEVKAPYLAVINAINESKAPVVSLDVPSGLDVDRGLKCAVGVRATVTLTFGLAKPGFFVNDGPQHVGRLRVLPIGYAPELIKEEATTHFAFTDRMLRGALPKRSSKTHKHDHGHALIFAGSPGMWGAGILAATSAYRMGAGFVTLASHTDPTEVLGQVPEILTDSASSDKLWAKSWTAAGIGSGLGANDDTYAILKRLMDVPGSQVVVDADAITVAAKRKMFPFPSDWILTPHAGELARVLGAKADAIEADRFSHALQASQVTGCHVLLKGFRTVVAKGDRAIVILAGNSALAKAGTGDVLTGMITGLLAQGVSPWRAAAAGAYIHGRMADEWVKAGNDKRSLNASDLREILPGLMSRLAHAT